jgi:MFS family permease
MPSFCLAAVLAAKLVPSQPMNQKLDVGNVLTRTFETYRDQFTLLVPAALLIFLPVAVLNAVTFNAGGVLALLLAIAIGVIATYWFQGMVVEAVRDILDGRRDHTVGSLFSSVAPVIGPLIGAGLLAGIATAIGFILLIVPGLFLLTIWAVLAPVIVVERPGVLPAFGRSQALVKGHGWQVFGVIAVLFLITVAATAVVQAILVGISDSFIGYFFSEIVVRVLVSPLSAIAAAVMFFELKARHGEPVLEPRAPAPAPPPATAPPAPAPPPAAPPTDPERPA